MKQSGVLSVAVAAIALASLAGCTSKESGPAQGGNVAPAASTSPSAASPAAPTLHVSLNAVMVALVDHASDPIFMAATKPPKTEEEWRELEYNAYLMTASASTIQLAGTGPNDKAWVAQPAWKSFAEEMGAAGLQALGMAQEKNVSAIEAVGNRLVEACEGCHKAFKPDIPSMGIMHKAAFPQGVK
ncbi:MAG: hypothetical protein ABL964_16520 [Steroidobacteraceae bacterium]